MPRSPALARGLRPRGEGHSPSGEDFPAHLRLALGADEPLLQSLIGVGQLPGVEAQQVQDGRLEVADGRLAFGDPIAEFVGGAEADAPPDPRARHPDREAMRVIVNREIVARGYGYAYTRFPFRYMEDFRAAGARGATAGGGRGAKSRGGREILGRGLPRYDVYRGGRGRRNDHAVLR